MKKLDEYRNLSEQDYGGFLEVATLWQHVEHDGTLFLEVSAGYGQDTHNDGVFYIVDDLPLKTLEEAFKDSGDCYFDPSRDQSKDFAEDLGTGVRQAKDSEVPNVYTGRFDS